uniref:Proteasome inhibitor PI31 subunit n=1 Tax=Monodelphis domestica TaxID=13616 RepID=A0A5F8GPV3_MONDO
MAGLELLYASAAPGITCPQDALICFVHWELVTHDYRALGTGDQSGPGDKKSELLPPGWNANKELYVLRYESTDNSRKLLLKAILVDGSMIINALECGSQQVVDLTLNVEDYVNGEHLGDFHRGQRGGMILDPLRSGFPRALIDPSSGLPNRLPPGAVPPGARFDPFGPIGTNPSGPGPDHLPPPGYDDMFM